jgi:hypothetical protein
MADKVESHSPEHWRDMAEQARRMAEGLATEANRRQLLEVAENYERLAREAEVESRRGRPS